MSPRNNNNAKTKIKVTEKTTLQITQEETFEISEGGSSQLPPARQRRQESGGNPCGRGLPKGNPNQRALSKGKPPQNATTTTATQTHTIAATQKRACEKACWFHQFRDAQETHRTTRQARIKDNPRCLFPVTTQETKA